MIPACLPVFLSRYRTWYPRVIAVSSQLDAVILNVTFTLRLGIIQECCTLILMSTTGMALRRHFT